MQLKPRLSSVSAETSDKPGQELFNHGIFWYRTRICSLNCTFPMFDSATFAVSVSWRPQLQACLMEQCWQTCRRLSSFSEPVILSWLKPHVRGLLGASNVLVSLISSFCCYEDVGSISQTPSATCLVFTLSLLSSQWWKSVSKTSLSFPSVVFCWHLMVFLMEQMQHYA